MSQSSNGQYNLAKFAFNIYGTLGTSQSTESGSNNSSVSSRASKQSLHYPPPPPPVATPAAPAAASAIAQRLTYSFDRDVQALGQLNCGIQTSNHTSGNEIVHHAVIGGKNYLRLLCLSRDQQQVLQVVNLQDTKSLYYRSSSKLCNVNTIKTRSNTIACGLSNGAISIYKVSPSGKGKLQAMLSDHKRTINSLDFIDSDNVIVSGSQDGTIKVWDLRAAEMKPMYTFQPNLHNDPIRACQYSPYSSVRNKTCILSVHDSGALCKFDLRSNSGNNTPERKWNLHTGPVLSLHIHPEREYVATAGRDHKICIFNFSDNRAAGRAAPDTIINTYGSILKVRWSTYPNYDDSSRMLEDSTHNSLASYDLACSYLNDDPTITIFNLNRKYVPKQVINSYTQKAFSNFLWAQNELRGRRIWTLNKSNQFSAFNLDSNFDSEIKRPLEDLDTMGMSWNGDDDFMMVNQGRDDFEVSEDISEFEDIFQETDKPGSFDYSESDFRFMNSVGANTNSFEKPPLVRSYTSNPMSQFGVKSPSPILRPSSGIDAKSSSTTSYGNANRPRLVRNSSQSTQESSLSYASAPNSANLARKRLSRSFSLTISPYAIPVQLPFNQEDVFRFLSTEYLVDVPEGFSLSGTCSINAQAASQVSANRTSQVWRLLSVALEEEMTTDAEIEIDEHAIEDLPAGEEAKRGGGEGEGEGIGEEYGGGNENGNGNGSGNGSGNGNGLRHDSFDVKSIQSDLGNVVGSFNSNSTSTNYGQNGPGSASGHMRSSARHRDSSVTNVVDVALHSRANSRSRLNSRANSFSRLSKMEKTDENEDGVVDVVDDNHNEKRNNDDNGNAAAADAISQHSQAKPVDINNPQITSLELENTNLMNSVFLKSSPTSIGIASSRSFSSLASSPVHGRGVLLNKPVALEAEKLPQELPFQSLNLNLNTNLSANLNKVTGSKIPSKPGLTQALYKSAQSEVWGFKPLLKKALDYAVIQGDIAFIATTTLLFYDMAKDVIAKQQCLEWLSLYIEILQRKGLFVNAAKVLNSAPKDVKEKLASLYSGDVVKLACSLCSKLLVNEKSKHQRSGEFGFWYCDECHQRQLNCVYCHEPCKGLVVAISLTCGHRGHFGCLKEWFIKEGNPECPGGCDLPVVA
ncbi:uncharacterized protein LODBEIA_P20030 [Lodderomyces beijingensis]|uniref:Restriction of telomere capping protein 1 n=1 Tax=Lodderomyces beijingensis TaxID=1775926 RepID=A0ABP0ZHY4_9ASCO